MAPTRTPTLTIDEDIELGDVATSATGGGVEHHGGDQSRPFFEGFLRIVVRTLLPFLSMWLAVLFPHFIILVIFMGGVLGSLISITIPAACYVKMFRSSLGTRELVGMWLIVMIGLAILSATLGLLILVHM